MASLQVVLLHAIEHLQLDGLREAWILQVARQFPGVPIFFVLSGFLVSSSLERSPSLSTYFIKRGLRIFPGLWVCLAVTIFSVYIVDAGALSDASVGSFTVWIAAQLSFLQFYNPVFMRDYGVGVTNGSLWTIPVELQFYILLPLVYFLIGFWRGRVRVELALILFFLVLSQLVLHLPISLRESIWWKLIYCSFVPHFWLFVLGVVMQRHFTTLKPLFEGRVIFWLIGYGVVLLLSDRLNLKIGSNEVNPLAAASLAGLVMAFSFSWRTLSSRVLNGTDLSYGIYIYHMVIVNALIVLGFSQSTAGLVLCFSITIVAAALSWRYIESPMIGLSKLAKTTRFSVQTESRKSQADAHV